MAAILFNDLIVFRRRSGIGHYAAQLLDWFPKVAADLPIVRLSELPRVEWVARAMSRTGGGGGGRAGLLGKTVAGLRGPVQAVLDRYLSWGARGDWALFHEPDAVAFRTSAPTVVSVMDLSVVLYPQWHPAHRVKKYETYFMRSLKQSAYFIAISEATRRDLIRTFGVKPDHTVAIPLAARTEFQPVAPAVVDAVRRTWKLPENYLLFVGNLEPRKNIPGLLRAYSRLPSALRVSCPLVLAGAWGWKDDSIRDMLERSPWRESVRHLGYLPDADLVAVTQGATALVYPSHYEGFGLPPLEAMAVGTPVISSHAGGLAEAVGNAAVVIDPNDEVAMASEMKRVLEDKDLRRSLSERGLERAAMFSWEKTALQTAGVYRRFLA